VRCVIFAAVSSAPQADEDKASIPTQITNARALIKRRGWQETHEPLVVSGQSRSIDFLHEAIAEIQPVADLVDLAQHHQIDLVIVRDYDRLARTRMLLTQLSGYLMRCKVQIYALDKPVEPTPVAQLGSLRSNFSSAAIVEAIAGISAQEEIQRIVKRRYFGVNKGMEQGRWLHSKTPYGYTRRKQTPGGEVMLDVPEIVPEEARILKRIERMYLREGLGFNDIADHLNAEKIPSATGSHWRGSTISWMLRNPFYCGYIVWGKTRTQRVYDEQRGEFVKRQVEVPAHQRLRKRLGRAPTLEELIRTRRKYKRKPPPSLSHEASWAVWMYSTTRMGRPLRSNLGN